MTDTEQVQEIKEWLDGLEADWPSRKYFCDQIRGALESMVEAERRGMERAAEILEKITGGWAKANGIRDWPMIKETADAIRDEAASKFPSNPSKATKYFCGVCWHKIKGYG